MTTSAKRLNDLLSSVIRSPPNSQFLDAVAKKLGLEGSDANLRSLILVYQSASNLKSDIDYNSDDKTFAERANALFAPIIPLLNFSNYHLNIEHAKKNFLVPETLTGLTDLHLMLRGISSVAELPQSESAEIAKGFQSLREKVVKSEELPTQLKGALMIRLNQITVAFDNFYAFGEEGLERELAGLVGSIVLHAHETPKEEGTLLKEIWEKVGSAYGLLKTVDWRCCTTLLMDDSHCETMRLEGQHDEALTRPLSHDELVQLQRRAEEARLSADLAGQGDGLACAA